MKLDRTIIKSLSLFDKMTDDQLDALLVPAQTKRLPIGESVFEQGQPASYFFLLLHGRLKVTQVTSSGQQIIVRVVHPGDLLGYVGTTGNAQGTPPHLHYGIYGAQGAYDPLPLFKAHAAVR